MSQSLSAKTILNSEYLPPLVQIQWLNSGKPVVEGLKDENVEVSLSHDHQVCLCVAGQGSQGCDIAPVTHRSPVDWIALLTTAREPLMQKLLANGSDSVDIAGTRIWAAIEALRKATDEKDINLFIHRQQEDSVLFRGTALHKELYILTFPLKLTRGTTRIVAMVVGEPETTNNHLKADFASQSHGLAINNHLKTDFASQSHALAKNYPNYNNDIYCLDTVTNTGDNDFFFVRWPVSYKQVANLSQKVYFSNFFAWIEKVRDLALWPIRKQLGEQLATGEWGMVTNHAQVEMFGEAGLDDIIEARIWIGNVSGATNSTVDFNYDWLKVVPHGGFERIAKGQLRMTWVKFSKYAAPEPQPLPEFIQSFIHQVPNYTPEVLPESLKEVKLGEEIYQGPTPPFSGPLLREQAFTTSLEETDAIGNINFSNYYIFQGRIRDAFFYNLIPDNYRRNRNQGEFRCLNSQVNFLREAFPFEEIQVRMSLQKLYERGISLSFEYFRLTADRQQQKLAIGKHDAVWLIPAKDGSSVSAPMPTKVREALLKAIKLSSL